MSVWNHGCHSAGENDAGGPICGCLRFDSREQERDRYTPSAGLHDLCAEDEKLTLLDKNITSLIAYCFYAKTPLYDLIMHRELFDFYRRF